ELVVDLFGARDEHPVAAHPTGRQHLEASGARRPTVVDADLQAALGAWTDHGELLLPPEADVRLLRGDLEIAEPADPVHDGLVQRSEAALAAGVDGVERVGFLRTGLSLRPVVVD